MSTKTKTQDSPELSDVARSQVAREAAMLPPTGNAVALAQTHTPPELLQLAIIKKSDITVIERMAALAERWQEATLKREQRIAFINAMVDAKLEMPLLVKNRHVAFKSNKGGADTDYWHEDLAQVVEVAQPVLAKHGLTFRWRTQQPQPGMVTVTCILEHRAGHAEENELTAAVDTSGNKNHIQAIKSVTTYLERTTALAACGLAARGQDDDGRAGGIKEEVPTINVEQVTQLMAKCDKVGCPHPKFLKWAKVENFEDIEADYFQACLDILDTFVKRSS